MSFSADGPDARAVLTYSESSDPANPHYADMTELFSNYTWVTLPCTEIAIRSDRNLKVQQLRGSGR